MTDQAGYANTKDGKVLAAWVRQEYIRNKAARAKKQSQWQINMKYVRGEQWIQRGKGQFADRTFTPNRNVRSPERKTINRTRMMFRSELARFMSSEPNIVGVPASSEAEDIRAAYAAEAAWEYLQQAGKLPYVLSDAFVWLVQTGNGFIKTWWDDDYFDRTSQQDGCVRYASIKPFELFIPDLRERQIEDQPYLTIATIKPLEWCQKVFEKELAGRQLLPSVASSSNITEEGSLDITVPRTPDSCIIYETWVKPGAHKLLPQGGLLITIDDMLLRAYPDGVPYPNGLYPITKMEHIPTGAFYADSPFNDTNGLQREYNRVRSDLAHSGAVYGQPHILAAKGSIVPTKIQNVAAQVVEYEPGMAPPSAMPMPEVPTYYVNQQEAILADWDDLSGRHDVSQGKTPPGVTAGTAINFLQERDDGFFTPELASIEWAIEDVARKSVALFQEYVDIPRKIQIIGSDQSFDIMMLQGADITKGTDIRVEVGSGQNESKAAHDAKVMDLWGQGVIQDPTMVLKMMKMGGPQRFLDVFDAAEAKAERENMKMKALAPVDVEAWEMQDQQEKAEFQMQQMMQQIQQQMMQSMQPVPGPEGAAPGSIPPDPASFPALGGDPSQPPLQDVMAMGAGTSDPSAVGAPPAAAPMDPSQPQPGDPGADPTQGQQDPASPFGPPPMGPLGPPPMLPIIPVDDFDVHEKHIVTHNTFRMSQEYELLSDGIKKQFALHVQQHVDALQRAQMQQFVQSIPSDGTDPSAPQAPDMSVDTGAPAPPPGAAGAKPSGNGVIAGPPDQGGQ